MNNYHSLVGFLVFVGMPYKGIYAKQLVNDDLNDKIYSMLLNPVFVGEGGLSLSFFEKIPLSVFHEYIFAFKGKNAMTIKIYIYLCSIQMMLS